MTVGFNEDLAWILLFWASAFVLAYTYVFYPIALTSARWIGKPWDRGKNACQLVTVVIVVRNEQERVGTRVRED